MKRASFQIRCRLSSCGRTALAVLALAVSPGVHVTAAPQTQAAQSTPKDRIKAVHDLAKQGGTGAIASIAPYLKDRDRDVRVEAVKAIVGIGTDASLAPLVQALKDNDPEVQMRATDGLVNFYLPGYVQSGVTAGIKRFGGGVVSYFSGSRNDSVIPPYVEVRADVIQAISELISGGSSMESRANAARAEGVLRAKAALPAIEQGLHAKDGDVIYECLVAIEKINDPSAAPSAQFLLHDFSKRIQLEAINLTGLLRNRAALPDLRDVFALTKDKKVKTGALEAIAAMPENQDAHLLDHLLHDKNPDFRVAAAEGVGRLGNASDEPKLKSMFEDENKPAPRMAAAFGDSMLGNLDMSDFAPLRYLVNQLNSAAWRGVSIGYLVELCRREKVREAIYPALGSSATRDEKTGLARVLETSGDRNSIPYVDKLSKDPDSDVATAGLNALRTLRMRFP
jgi:HEAT repeat protein